MKNPDSIIGLVQNKYKMPCLEEFWDTALRLGFHCAEFKFEPTSPFGNPQKNFIRRVYSEAARHQMKLSVHAPYDQPVNFGAKDPSEKALTREAMLACLDFAQTIGASYMTVHGGILPLNDRSEEETDAEFEAMKAQVLEELKWFSGKMEDSGIKMGIENLHSHENIRRFPVTPAEVNLCVESTGASAAVMLDIGHLNYTGLTTPEYIKALETANLIGFHVHDNDGRGDQHNAIGEGEIDFKTFVVLYDAKQWSAPLNIETNTIEKALNSRDRLRSLLNRAPGKNERSR